MAKVTDYNLVSDVNDPDALYVVIDNGDGTYSSRRIEISSFRQSVADISVDSVSALQSASLPASQTRVWLLGYYGVGTAGGGPLYRDSSDTTTADNGGTVFVDADGVRWKRPKTGDLHIEDFGAQESAVVDASKDIGPALRAARDVQAAEGRAIVFPGKWFYYSTVTDSWHDNTKLIFNGTHIITDATDTPMCAINGADGSPIKGLRVEGDVLMRRTQGVTEENGANLFDLRWLEDFYVHNVTGTGPDGDYGSALIRVQDCMDGRVNFSAGIDIGQRASAIFQIRNRDVSVGTVLATGAAEAMDWSMCEWCSVGHAYGNNCYDETLDVGNSRHCHANYVVGKGSPKILNVKMEGAAATGLMSGSSQACSDNVFDYVHGDEFTNIGITMGTNSQNSAPEEFSRNVVKYVSLTSTQPGSKGLSINGGDPANDPVGVDNVVRDGFVKVDGRAIEAVNNLRRLRIESGRYESTGGTLEVGYVANFQVAEPVDDLYVGEGVQFIGRTDIDQVSVYMPQCAPLTFKGEIDGSGREGIRLIYDSLGESINTEISASVKNTGRRGIVLSFDVSSTSEVADVRVHNNRIRGHSNEAIQIINGTNELRGVMVDNNKIYCDGTNDGITWPADANVDYCADRDNDIFNAATVRTNSPGTNGILRNGIET